MAASKTEATACPALILANLLRVSKASMLTSLSNAQHLCLHTARRAFGTCKQQCLVQRAASSTSQSRTVP